MFIHLPIVCYVFRAMHHDKDALAFAQFLAMPCGMIRGALAALGFAATVHADVINIPACECFVIHAAAMLHLVLVTGFIKGSSGARD